MGATEVGSGRGLDPVGPLAEVDRVQVLGEDLVFAPVAFQPVGERRFAELLQDRATALRDQGALHELLGDRRGALLRRLRKEVLDEGATDSLEVDSVVLVEAGVFDRDGRVLHVGGDLRGAEEDLVVVAGQGADLFAVGVEDDAVLRRLELGEVIDRRQILGDRGHHPEDRRDQRQKPEPREDEEEAQLLQPRPVTLRRKRGRRRGRRNDAAGRLAVSGAVLLGALRKLLGRALTLDPPGDPGPPGHGRGAPGAVTVRSSRCRASAAGPG